jgi:hypothetical protein
VHEPVGTKDFNDMLRAKPHPLLPLPRPGGPHGGVMADRRAVEQRCFAKNMAKWC